jgi:hypothetical protein
MFRLKESRLPDHMKEEYEGMPRGMFRPRPAGLPEYSLRSPYEVHGDEIETVAAVASMLAMARVGLEFEEAEIARQAVQLAFVAYYVQATPETMAEALFYADPTVHEPWRQAENEGSDDGDYGTGVLAPVG